MRSLAFAVVLLIAGVAAAVAQPTPTKPGAAPSAAAPTPPKVFLAEGYSQPDITPGLCKNVDAQRTVCTIPAMTAGTYYAEALGSSTATAEGAAQQITIAAGAQSCTSRRGQDPKTPWAVGAERSLRGGCLFTVVTDAPMTIIAIYLDDKANKDAKGPLLSVRRMPWAGALSAMPVDVKQ